LLTQPRMGDKLHAPLHVRVNETVARLENSVYFPIERYNL